ncbi:FKBP-type peptidyl-prolyl cis-trans isomerase [bacterium SCSIO 12741]|nr:FKBP-type peptidyl-prolyl cis-trans isomerase [bacterium SCSIO 12741]
MVIRIFALVAFISLAGSTWTFAQDTITTPSGLKYYRIQEGKGPEIKPGNQVKVFYRGMLADGSVFEDPGVPIKFVVGEANIIPGWNEGIQLMREGETALLILPAELGYGSRGSKDENDPNKYVVPPNAKTWFEIQVVKVK